MSKKFFTMLALSCALLIGMSACQKAEPDTHMGVATWTVSKAAYDKAADAVTRAYAELLVSGYHQQPYSCTYTIDGKQGVGELAIHRLPKNDAGTNLRTGIFDGNCPSGTPLEIDCYKVNNLTEQYQGLARFLMPLLEPGIHTFSATVTNEYGESITETRTFEVEGK